MVRRVSVDGAPVTATAAAFGYSRPSYYQAAAALAASGLDGLVPARPGPRGGHKLTGQILTWAEQQLAGDPALKPGAAWPGRSPRHSACACTPVRSSERWPAAGSALQKPLTCPPPSAGRRRTRPCPCAPSPGRAAAEPGPSPPARMPARLVLPAAGWTPATSNCVMPPCTRARPRSRSASACSPAAASPPGGTPWPTWPAHPPPATARTARHWRPGRRGRCRSR